MRPKNSTFTSSTTNYILVLEILLLNLNYFKIGKGNKVTSSLVSEKISELRLSNHSLMPCD